MTFGVGVEGPSDKHFWDKVLHKHFKGHLFDVCNMKNRDKLIRETPRLLNQFQNMRYAAGFILVDMDDDRCVTAVINHFDTAIKATRTKCRLERFLHLCVAMKEIESWYLADEDAIKKVVPQSEYTVPADTGKHSKGTLKSIVKQTLGKSASFNEIDFAKRIAPAFSPKRARGHSKSFGYFWSILEKIA